ncbi:hypothetical protein [Shewanella sp. YLB-07]|uniref:hypothetical protein n=1 Tax=Shewanella sp. YLB-07 TaxID=2601268 RepID=UPI00128BC2A6|nr:hypothetical protein [Shewanella sp. YLB-07]MPY21254.1 hypothetical protein [Shewanella sp. YLB-07]MPY22041.1 hypothetical protein [Shewanella sp. YLB-07]
MAIFSQINKGYLDSALQLLAVNFRFLSLMITATLLTACGGDDDGFPSYETFSPPTATQLSTSPQAEVDTILSLDYQFNDAANRPEGGSKVSWYLDNQLQNHDSQFTPSKLHEGQWLHFCVTPIAAYGNNNTGSQVCSIAELILPTSGSVPVAENILIISPLQPGSKIEGSYLYTDADDDAEAASQLIWRLNSSEVAQGLHYLLPVNSEGAILSFCVTPKSLTGEPNIGAEACDTKTVIGSYTPPTASKLLISPTPVIGNLLNGSYLYNDANNRPEGDSLLSWEVDGTEVATGSTVTLVVADEGKDISFCVTPLATYGQNAIGLQVCSAPSNIDPKAGSAPVASSLAISSPLQPGQSVTASYFYSDADGDIEASSLTQWRIDNLASGTGLSLTLPIDSEGKTLQLCVTPIAQTGSPKQGLQVCFSQNITGTYSAPTATILLISPAPVVGTLLTGSYLYNDANSRPEGDRLLTWKLDGTEVSAGETLTLAATDEGKILTFCVTPVAAYGINASGTQVCSTPASIFPKAGSAPEASGLTISSPLQPGQSVTASYLYSDANGDIEASSLTQWRIDNLTSGTGLSLTLPIDSEGKTLQLCVTPIAQTGSPKQGLQVCFSQNITGTYSAPTATILLISPTPVIGTLLTGSYLYNDANSRPEGASLLTWKLDGTEVSAGETLTFAATDEGKILTFCVTPVAAYGINATGTQVCSTPASIFPKAGSAPEASGLTISSPLQPGQSVTASYLYSDANGDIEASSLTQWLIDNLASGTGLSLTLPIDSEGKTLQLCVTPIAQTGSPKQGLQVCFSQNITGTYTAPTATILLISPTPVVGTLLTGSYLYNDANSRPEGASLLSWQVDGTEIATGSTVTLVVADEGKDISFCVTPLATYGQNATGDQVCTLAANINPKAGSAPSTTNLSWDTFVKPSTFLTVSYDFIDSDGDAEGVSLFSWKLDNVEVSQNISYTPLADSGGKSLSFCVTAVAVSGTPKIGSQACITTDIAAILLTGELKLNQTLTLDVKGYSETGVTWKSTNPADNAVRSTSNTSYTISRLPITQSAFRLVGYDVEVCVTTVEEGEICNLVSQYPVTSVTGGLPMTLDGSNQITSRAIASVDYIELTIATVTKRLHRPLSIIESVLLNAAIPASPLHDGQDSEIGSNVLWGLYTWPNADALCTTRGMTLAVEGNTDVSNPFGLKQFYDAAEASYPEFASAHVGNALGWGVDNEYYWSSSDIGGGSHRDFYMVTGSPGSIADTTPEYAACLELVP